MLKIVQFLLLFLLISSYDINAQNSTCATAASLVIGGTTCSGTTGGSNSGDPTGFDDTDGNVCSSTYSGGDDFIFEYTATTTDGLKLDLFATNTWTGLMVTEGCPTTGTCFASALSSSANESLTTQAMTIGTTYYIHISTYPTPQSPGQFCLDASLETPGVPHSTCATAQALVIGGTMCTGTLGGSNSGDPTGFDDTDGNVCSSNYSGGDDFIFEYTATTTDGLKLDLFATNTWTGLMVTEGCPITGTCFESAISGSANESLTTPAMTIGTTYYIHISTYPTPQSPGQFCLDASLETPPIPPVNDACDDATSITNGGSLTGSTTLSTNVESLTACSGGGGGASCTEGGTGSADFTEGVWYVYTSTGSETITFSTSNVGTTFDTEIQVWSGVCGSLTCIGGDDDGGDGTGSAYDSEICWVSTASFAPVDYYIYVDGHAGAVGDLAVSLVAEPVLPIVLHSFEGKVSGKNNKLMWKTLTEQNTEMHIIERSIDSKNWEMVEMVEAAGFTTEESSYEVLDTKPMMETYYRLKSVDFDGHTDYSNVIHIRRNNINEKSLVVYPNPFTNEFNIQLDINQEQNVTIEILSSTGKLIRTKNVSGTIGTNLITIDTETLNTGLYFVKVSYGSEYIVERIMKN